MKAIPYTDNIYYFNRKTKKKESKFDKVSRDFRYIPRADNPDKSLSRVSRTLASNYDDMICKDSSKIIFVSHKFISGITEVGNRQNNNIHKQLLDVFNIKYNQSVVIDGKKYRDGFTVQYTENTEIILKNPKLFYAKKSKETCQLDGKKLPPRKKKITTSKYTANPKEQRERRALNYGENPIEEKEEEALAYSSSFSVTSITNAKSKEVKKEFSQEETIEERTLAASPFEGLAKVQQKEEIRRETGFSPNQSAEEEKEYLRSHGKRESLADEPIPLVSLPIFAKFRNPHISEEKEKTPTVIIEKIEETPEIGYNSREPDNLNENCEMETDINSLIFKAFGRETGNQLIENCEINLIEPDKIGIKLHQGITITNYEKEQLRSCIRSKYGENVKIVSMNKSDENPRVNKDTDVQSRVETPERLELWEIFKKEFGDFLERAYRDSSLKAGKKINAIFGKMERSQILSENKLIFKGSTLHFTENFNYKGVVEEIAIKHKIIIEFHETASRVYESERCTVFPKPIYPQIDFDKYDKLYPRLTRSEKRSENVKRQSECYYVGLNENGVAILIKK